MSSTGEGFEHDLFVGAEERNPQRAARQAGEKPRLRRFYKVAVAAPAAGGFAILLDGKPLRTPAKAGFVAPNEALAQAVAAEWEGQGEYIEPATMPLTRLANSAIDGVAARMAEVEADAAKYAGSDLICYRAGEPEGLAKAEAEAWDPLLRFAREKCGARLLLVEGLIHQPQPETAVAALAASIRAYVGDGPASPFRLAALHAMTALSGSCVIALAVATGEIGADAGFDAAQVDEDYQLRLWGADSEALARRERRREEMHAAAQMSWLAGRA